MELGHRATPDRLAPALAEYPIERHEDQPDHDRVRDRYHRFSRVSGTDELHRRDHPSLRVDQPLSLGALGLVGRATVGGMRLRVVGGRFVRGHALPGAVVKVVEAMEDPQVRHPGRIRDDLRGRDGAAEWPGVDGGQADVR